MEGRAGGAEGPEPRAAGGAGVVEPVHRFQSDSKGDDREGTVASGTGRHGAGDTLPAPGVNAFGGW